MTLTQSVRAIRARLIVPWLAALVLALAACSGASSPSGPITASPALASQPQTIHVIEHPINSTTVRVGSLTGCTNTTSCQGDFYLGDNPLFDAATGTEVGTLKYECFVIDTGSSLYHCPGNTVTLTGRGQIVFTETVDFDRPAGERGPVTGGTDEFLGATGVVTSPGLEDFVVTITR
jgi:hypothetical protein